MGISLPEHLPYKRLFVKRSRTGSESVSSSGDGKPPEIFSNWMCLCFSCTLLLIVTQNLRGHCEFSSAFFAQIVMRGNDTGRKESIRIVAIDLPWKKDKSRKQVSV
jgi:hypothetical protein